MVGDSHIRFKNTVLTQEAIPEEAIPEEVG